MAAFFGIFCYNTFKTILFIYFYFKVLKLFCNKTMACCYSINYETETGEQCYFKEDAQSLAHRK